MVWNDSKAITAITGSLFQPFLETASLLSRSAAGKLFVFPVVQDVADKSDANKEGSLNQGFKTVLLEGKPAYEFKVFAGQSLVPQLRKFNNQSLRVLMLDNHNRVWGVKSGVNFIGAQAKIFTGGLKYADGQNVNEGVATISVSYLKASELNDDAAFGEVVSTAGITGLIDAQLTNISHVTNVWKIGAQIATAEIGQTINVADTYSTELAAAGLWVAKTGATYGTTLAITSVAYDAALNCWTVTFDNTAYGLLSSGANIKLNFAAPGVLNAAGVESLEGLEVILTK